MEIASPPAVVPMNPPSEAAVAASTSKPVPPDPIIPKSVVFGARNPWAYLPAIVKASVTVMTPPILAEKAPKRALSFGKSGTPVRVDAELAARES